MIDHEDCRTLTEEECEAIEPWLVAWKAAFLIEATAVVALVIDFFCSFFLDPRIFVSMFFLGYVSRRFTLSISIWKMDQMFGLPPNQWGLLYTAIFAIVVGALIGQLYAY